MYIHLWLCEKTSLPYRHLSKIQKFGNRRLALISASSWLLSWIRGAIEKPSPAGFTLTVLSPHYDITHQSAPLNGILQPSNFQYKEPNPDTKRSPEMHGDYKSHTAFGHTSRMRFLIISFESTVSALVFVLVQFLFIPPVQLQLVPPVLVQQLQLIPPSYQALLRKDSASQTWMMIIRVILLEWRPVMIIQDASGKTRIVAEN